VRYRTFRIARVFAGLLMIAGICFFTPTAPAQGGPGGPHPRGRWGGPGFGPGAFGSHGAAKVVTGEPYSAQAVTTMEQTLSNGTTITRTITATIARDSEGRTMRSQTMGGFGGGSSNGATIVTIFDPVAGERIEYNTASKKARIFMLPQNQGSSEGSSQGFKGRPGGARGNFSSQVTVATTSLGTETLDNVSVQGTQTTHTIAAGAVGNNQPLVTTQQEWYSPDLEMVLQSTRNDPRFGQTTYTVNNLQRSEPNASLFQVPAGYQSQTVEPPSRHSAQ
jgi:hypothetical protein